MTSGTELLSAKAGAAAADVSTPNEHARWLLPLMREYAEKVGDVSARIGGLYALLSNRNPSEVFRAEAGRLICISDTLQRAVTDVARRASGLIEHSHMDEEIDLELRLRSQELEEHLRFAPVMVEQLKAALAASKDLPQTRVLIEKTRYKSPV